MIMEESSSKNHLLSHTMNMFYPQHCTHDNNGWATIDPPTIDPPTIDPPTIKRL